MKILLSLGVFLLAAVAIALIWATTLLGVIEVRASA